MIHVMRGDREILWEQTVLTAVTRPLNHSTSHSGVSRVDMGPASESPVPLADARHARIARGIQFSRPVVRQRAFTILFAQFVQAGLLFVGQTENRHTLDIEDKHLYGLYSLRDERQREAGWARR